MQPFRNWLMFKTWLEISVCVMSINQFKFFFRYTGAYEGYPPRDGYGNRRYSICRLLWFPARTPTSSIKSTEWGCLQNFTFLIQWKAERTKQKFPIKKLYCTLYCTYEFLQKLDKNLSSQWSNLAQLCRPLLSRLFDYPDYSSSWIFHE